jgi:hypothetical protein
MILTERKTNGDLETAALQVSFYHYALEKLISGDELFPWEALWRCCNLDPDLALPNETLHWIAERTRERPELGAIRHARTLKDLASILDETIRELVPADTTIQQWIATPANRTSAAIFNRAHKTQFHYVQYDPQMVDSSLQTALNFWQSRKLPSGPLADGDRICGYVIIIDTFKCYLSTDRCLVAANIEIRVPQGSRLATNQIFLDSHSRNVEGNKHQRRGVIPNRGYAEEIYPHEVETETALQVQIERA